MLFRRQAPARLQRRRKRRGKTYARRPRPCQTQTSLRAALPQMPWTTSLSKMTMRSRMSWSRIDSHSNALP